jgi:AraC family transcriptional regulator of adaptative response/methylated-DNA-[protein]-cysteine methyltransferase
MIGTKERANRTKAPRFSTGESCWRAVIKKDTRADGQFWFAVKTTGVFCRPSCPSRPAKRENVVFYPTIKKAEQAGFRACQRCDPKGMGLAARHAAAVASACRLIEQAGELPSLDQIASAVKMSPGHLHRLFKAATGLTPKDYAGANRARRVKKALPRRKTVTEAIYEAGFNSSGRFYAGSAKMLGMKPSEYRKGGTGKTIRFAIGACSLGSILVAATPKGICAIFLGDEPEVLIRNLQAQFPKADLVGGDGGFKKWIARVVGFVDSPRVGLDLPLDIRGTAFQQRVWKGLQQIPVGQTVSYSELAKKIGLPKSVRAVAQACGANILAVAIPCHRVIRTNGDISGYRWGAARKKKLLASEKN